MYLPGLSKECFSDIFLRAVHHQNTPQPVVAGRSIQSDLSLRYSFF